MSEQKKRAYKLDINAADHSAATSVQLADQLLHDTVKLTDTARRISSESKAMLALLNEARQSAVREDHPDATASGIVRPRPTDRGMMGRVQAVRAAASLVSIFGSLAATHEGLERWEIAARQRSQDTPFSISGYSLSPMRNTGTDRLMVRLISGRVDNVSHYVSMADLLTLAIYGAKVLERAGHLTVEAERDEDADHD